MGCDIHAVLQKKVGKSWKTIDVDVLGGRNYDLFGLLSEVRGESLPDGAIMNSGLPQDFEVDAENNHDGFFMGEHSFGHITLQEFCAIEIPANIDSLNVEVVSPKCVKVSTRCDAESYIEDEDGRYHSKIALQQLDALQTAFLLMYGNHFSDEYDSVASYRLVVGYDS